MKGKLGMQNQKGGWAKQQCSCSQKHSCNSVSSGYVLGPQNRTRIPDMNEAVFWKMTSVIWKN